MVMIDSQHILAAIGTGANSVQLGDGADAAGADSISIGNNTPGASAIAIGNISTSSSNSIAMGVAALAQAKGISIGETSRALVGNATAVGYQARANSNGVSYGYKAGRGLSSYQPNSLQFVAIGAETEVGDNSNDYTGPVAIGWRAACQNHYAGAIGHQASSNYDNGWGLGRSAAATAAGRLTVGTISGSYDMELQCGKGFAAWGSAPPGAQPTVTGSRGGNAALTSLLTAIAATGLIVDGTSA